VPGRNRDHIAGTTLELRAVIHPNHLAARNDIANMRGLTAISAGDRLDVIRPAPAGARMWPCPRLHLRPAQVRRDPCRPSAEPRPAIRNSSSEAPRPGSSHSIDPADPTPPVAPPSTTRPGPPPTQIQQRSRRPRDPTGLRAALPAERSLNVGLCNAPASFLPTLIATLAAPERRPLVDPI